MQKYKVDWLAFTISFVYDGDKRCFDENILEVLRFDKGTLRRFQGAISIVVRLITNTKSLLERPHNYL